MICSHQWGEVVRTDIQSSGMWLPGDISGGRYSLPEYIPGPVLRRWHRVCLVCGYLEETDRSLIKTTTGAYWRPVDTGYPVFGSDPVVHHLVECPVY